MAKTPVLTTPVFLAQWVLQMVKSHEMELKKMKKPNSYEVGRCQQTENGDRSTELCAVRLGD